MRFLSRTLGNTKGLRRTVSAITHLSSSLAGSTSATKQFSTSNHLTKIGNDEENGTICSSTHPMLGVDTWERIGELLDADHTQSRLQCEALISTISRITQYRLQSWKRELVTTAALEEDMHMLTQSLHQIGREHRVTMAINEETDAIRQRRLVMEMNSAADAGRDLVAACKMDTMLGIAEMREEGKESMQRCGKVVESLKNDIAQSMLQFKSGTEQLKVRSTALFTALLCAFTLLVASDRLL